MKTFIYILLDPRDNQVKYVGKTINPQRRYSQHRYEATHTKSYKNNWFLSLLLIGIDPQMVVIDECDKDEWEFFEQWYIDVFKAWGFKLTNLTNGGKGVAGYVCSKEERMIRSERAKKIFSKEICKKGGLKGKGRVHTEKAKKHFSIAAKKRGISPETRLKMIESRKRNGNYSKSEQTKKNNFRKIKNNSKCERR